MPLPHPPNNIDAIRISLALLVLFSHSYDVALGTNDQEPLKLLTRGQFSLGELAVDGFFILSGYLVSQSWANSSTAASFLRKRFWRVFPGYWMATAICLFAIAPCVSSFDLVQLLQDNGWRALLLRGVYVPTSFPTNPYPGVMNGSLWSISCEWWCYIGLLMLGIMTVLNQRSLVLALFAASLIVSVQFDGADLNWPTGGGVLGVVFGAPRIWVRMLPMFLAGMTAFAFRRSLAFTPRAAVLAMIGLAVAARTPPLLTLAAPTLGAYLLLYLGFAFPFCWRSAAARGDPSYGIYLYAFPIQQIIVSSAGYRLAPGELFTVALLPTIAAGYLSWHLIEKRFLPRRTR